MRPWPKLPGRDSEKAPRSRPVAHPLRYLPGEARARTPVNAAKGKLQQRNGPLQGRTYSIAAGSSEMAKSGDVYKPTTGGGIWPLLILGRDGMLLVLTWAAGSVDAISYLGLGHVFTAMMTGNTVLLGLAIGQGQVLAALRSVIALAGFCLGAAVGAFIVEREEKRQEWPPVVTVALPLQAITLALFTIAWFLTDTPRSAGMLHILILLSGLAIGIQAVTVRHLGVPGIATTYITGTLTSLMVDLTGFLRRTVVPSFAARSLGKDVPGASAA